MNDHLRLHQLANKFLSNSCSKTEMEELLQWVNKAEYDPKIKQLLSDHWDELSELAQYETMGSLEKKDVWFHEIYSESLTREGIELTNQLKRTVTPKKRTSFDKRKSNTWIKLAAVFLVSVFVYFFYQTLKIEEEKPVQEIVYEKKTSEAGEKVRFLLPDGTQVHLNSESSLEYPVPFDENNREVHLIGEAYFIVNHEESRPFIVHTHKLTTRVLGTSFNKRSYPENENISVAVSSGRVVLLNSNTPVDDQQVILEADEWANYSNVTNEFDTGSGDINAFTAWNENVLLYHDKKLIEVASELERWYEVSITFENESLEECVIRGEHRNETLVNVLDAIVYAFDMHYEIEERNVFLSGEGCS